MWRDTALSTKLFGVDGTAIIPAMIFLIHWSWLTFYISAGGIVLFFVLQKMNIRITDLFRLLLRGMGSKRRYPVSAYRYNRRVNR